MAQATSVTSRAVVLSADGVPQLQTVATPTTPTGCILLHTRVSGLCGTDLFKLSAGSDFAGQVLGHEIVGEVVESHHPEFAPGSRLVVPHHQECGTCRLCRLGSTTQCETFREQLLQPGGFASLISVDPRALMGAARVVPDHLADEDAVFLEPGACVLRGIQRAQLPSDTPARVAILGAGSMGLLHALVLHAQQPDVAIVLIEPDAKRRRLAAELLAGGNTPTISSPEGASGTNFDAVFDTVGGELALEWAVQKTRRGGTIVLFAHAAAKALPRVDLNRLFHREVNLVTTYSGSLSEQDTIWKLLCSGALRPSSLVTHQLPIENFAEGVRLARERRALKVLFRFESAGRNSEATLSAGERSGESQ